MKQARNYKTRCKPDGTLQVFTRGAWRTAERHECVHCGKEFLAAKGNISDSGRYCGYECAGQEHTKANARRATYNKCVVCGIRFRVPPSKKDRYKTCGKAYCKHINRREVGLEKWAARQEKQRQKFIALREARNEPNTD